MPEPSKIRGKLRITKEWEKSRIMTFLKANKCGAFTEREIIRVLGWFMIEESSRPKQAALNSVIAVKFPRDALNELEHAGLIKKIEKQDSGKSVFYYSIK